MRITALFLALVLPAAATNVVFIMADDRGYMDTGFNNPKKFYDTPNLNGLAKQGMRFTAGYAACPVCSPTRSSILTGQYLPFYSVHTPLMGRPDLVEKYEAKRKKLGLKVTFSPEPPRENRTVQEHAVYAAMVVTMDHAVGKVLKAIDDNGLADDTIVIFFSDNGGLSISEGSPTCNLPCRAGKGWTYEGGNKASVITPEKVKAVREATEDVQMFLKPADLPKEHPME